MPELLEDCQKYFTENQRRLQNLISDRYLENQP